MKKTKYFQNCLGVFQGGGCRASAYVGAYKEATDWGVSFSELVGTSAGAIIAAFIGAGATPDDLERIIDDLDFNSFLGKVQDIPDCKTSKSFKLFKKIPHKAIKKYSPIITHLGLYNSDLIREWVDDKLSELLPQNARPIKFRDLLIPTNIIVSDIKTKRIEIYNQEYSANLDVAEAVQYSCNIPIFFQPIHLRYVDGGVLSNLPSFIYNNNPKKIYNKVLAFSLESEVSESNTRISNFLDYGKALINTAIDGNLDLQLSLQEDIHIIKINTEKIKATDFNSITKDDITKLKNNGINAVRDFFNNELSNIKINNIQSDIAKDSFATYNRLTQLLEHRYKEIIVFDDDNKWVYDIFPTILKWLVDKTQIYFLCKENNNSLDEHKEYRTRFLNHIGIETQYIDNIPFRGFIFDGEDRANCRAVVFNNKKEDKRFHSKYYHGEEDSIIINLIRNQYIDILKENKKYDLKLESVDINEIIMRLRKVRQYNDDNINISLSDINIKDITFLTKYVRGYRFRQIESLFNLYKRENISFFTPAKLELLDDQHTLVTPPIIEKIGDKYFLIEGNARLLYAYKNKISSLQCIIIEGVQESLPSNGRYNVQEILLTDRELIGSNRYERFDYNKFREIERAIRDPKTSLIS